MELLAMFKGKIGEKLVEADLIKKGIEPYLPSIDNTKCDLVAFTKSNFYKLQVKCGKQVSSSQINFDIRRTNGKYTDESFDILALVDIDTYKVAYIHKKDLKNNSRIIMRTTRDFSMNGLVNQKNAANIFDDYLEFPAI